MIKKKIYLAILIISTLVVIFFYQKSFQDKEIEIKKENFESESQSNLIKNLKYDVNFENKTSYSITALESEIIYEDEIEIILMKNV